MDIHDGYWSEPSDELDSDGKPIKRQRWVFTNPAHPSNQTGQGSPALSGEISHNSSEVNNGKSEPGNRRGRADHGGDFSANGNKRGERQAETPTESQPVAERGAIRGGRDNVSDREVSGEENRAVDPVGTGNSSNSGGGVDDAQPGKPGDDSRLAGGVVAEAVNSTGEKPVISTGGNSPDVQNQSVTPSEKSTGEKKKGRGRPKKQNSEKPFSPQYYEWRGDSGGWKLIHRPPLENGKLGYEYVGFLNPQRWEFFRRFNDEQFIKAVTRLFEKRKQGRPVRYSGLRLAG